MAVPARTERVAKLLDKLGLSDEVVVWDIEHAGHVPTWWRTIKLATKTNPSHILILEDDAEPCLDFLATVEKLIAMFPDRIISFYTAQTARDPQKPGQISLYSHYHAFGDVAVVYPTEWLKELEIDYRAQAANLTKMTWQAGFGADEMRMKLRPKQLVWNTAPSLVQHGCPTDSTLGHRFPRGLARPYIGSYTSPLSLDWAVS